MPPARSANRRNAPQTQVVASAPTRRRARSQSHEEVTEEATTKTPGRRTRSTRQSSVESTNSVESHGGRTTRSSRRVTKNAATDLDTVEEDLNSQLQETAVSPAATRLSVRQRSARPGTIKLSGKTTTLGDADDEAIEIASHHRTSPGRLSNISGTTAYSAEIAAEIDIQDILTDLPRLYNEADDILDQIKPHENSSAELERIITEIQNSGSRISKTLTRRGRVFEEYFKTFSTQGFIRCSTILRALFTTTYANVPVGDERPDTILYKANLAAFALQISRSSSEQDRSDTFRILREVDQSFPVPFMSAFTETDEPDPLGRSALVDQTLKLSVEIRTQLVIAYLSGRQDSQEVNPHQVIADIFLAPEDVDEAASFDEIFTNGDVRKVNMPGLDADREELDARFEELAAPRIGKLRGFFKDAEEREEPFDLEMLAQQFPWPQLISYALQWVTLRDIEIENNIGGETGAKRITNQLSQKVTASRGKSTRGRLPNTEQADTTESGDTTLRESDLNDLNALKDLEVRVSARQQQEQDDWQPAAQDDHESEVVQQPASNEDHFSSTAQLRGIAREHTRQNKENLRRKQESYATTSPKRSFVDRQVGATRVEWTEAQGEPSASQAKPVESQDAGKRRREEAEEAEDEEPSEDEGFAPAKHPVKAASPKKRPRFSEMETSPLRRANQTQRTSRPAKVQRFVPSELSSSAPRVPATEPTRQQPQATGSHADSPSSTPWSTQHSLVNAQAKSRVQFSSQPRKQQVRTPWSKEEVDTFVELITQHGPAYSTILREDKGDVLQNRTQVNLKDKAMNMKMDYLKVKTGMPLNFNQIPIRKQHVQYLLDNGIFDSEEEIRNWQ